MQPGGEGEDVTYGLSESDDCSVMVSGWHFKYALKSIHFLGMFCLISFAEAESDCLESVTTAAA